tara:strand:- start:897 stop:1136 length:240 start_codon:yes stop_codon:yes gene_type:complete
MGGVAVQAVKKIISPSKPSPAPVYTPSPTRAEVSQITSTAATSAMGLARGKGRSSTILTGAKGLGDNALTTTKKTLLGG